MRTLLAALLSLFFTACTINGPVTTQSTVDDRPSVTFDVGGYNPVKTELLVDNFSYGSVAKYLSTQSALKLLPGHHLIEVYYKDQLVYSKKQFFAESTLSVIKVYEQ